MIVQRGQYISELINKRWNGKVKISPAFDAAENRSCFLTYIRITC